VSNDALYLVFWADAMGNNHIAGVSPDETLRNATSAARDAGAVASIEQLLHIDPETQIEVKLFCNATRHVYAVRVYDRDVGETVGVTSFPEFADALTYYRLCTGVETKPSSFGVL
jgi:hypothetical protein